MRSAGILLWPVLLATFLFNQCNTISMDTPMRFELNCRDLSANPQTSIESGGYTVEILHREGEPANANRILISRGDLKVEVLPSKGFSIGQFTLDGKPVFWEAPIGLPDPDKLDFASDDLYIFGEQVEGFEFLKTFIGGIEVMGLQNWGMPRPDPLTGDTLPLHGEAGNIPVERASFEVTERGLTARAEFFYRTMEGEEELPWYERGQELYRVTRTLILDNEFEGLNFADSIQNVSGGPLTPDWGYHVTFHPEAGSRLFIPSLQQEVRGGGELPAGHDSWQPAADERLRTEIGIIHKGLYSIDLAGTPTTRILKQYPDGRAFELNIPLAPYFQTWSSCGGSDTKEFAFANGTPLFKKSWNGFGIEFGSSALDDDGNIDSAVPYTGELKPGESIGIVITVQQLEKSEAGELSGLIREYNSGGK